MTALAPSSRADGILARTRRADGSSRIGSIGAHGLLIVTSFIVLGPLLWIVRTALVDRYEAYKIPPVLGASLSLDSFHQIFSVDEFTPYIVNSLLVATGVTALALLLGAPAAYAIARYRTGGAPLRIGILIGQMFPPIVLVVPIFVIARSIGQTDTISVLIVAYLSSNIAFVIWSLVGFFSSIARDSEEAALIDGCNQLQAIRHVLLPLSLPGLFAAAVISFILSWNEFLFALELTGPVARTFPVAIASLVSTHGVQIGPTCAAVTAIAIPTAGFALIIRKFLIGGVTLGGVKG